MKKGVASVPSAKVQLLLSCLKVELYLSVLVFTYQVFVY